MAAIEVDQPSAPAPPAATSPADWPAPGPIDLEVQDLPHASATLEWWYVNGHARTVSGREVSLFASFFRTAIAREERSGEYVYAYALTWALIDPVERRYLRESLVDQCAPSVVQRELERGLGITDPLLRKAMREVVDRGVIPAPDVTLTVPCLVGERRLFLDYAGRRFQGLGDGEYALELRNTEASNACDLRLRLTKPVVRHGDRGIVRGNAGERMFYYFSPRCILQGSITIDGVSEDIAEGSAWYDHEFGSASDVSGETALDTIRSVSWDWMSVQFDNGWDLTIYCMYDDRSGAACGRYAILVDPSGHTRRCEDFVFSGRAHWTSSKTFASYPTAWQVQIPEVGLCLDAEAAFPAQEFVTMISRPGFWEGRISVRGEMCGGNVTGTGFVERSGFERNDTLSAFFGAVGVATRRSVEAIMPLNLELNRASAGALVGGERHLAGVELARLGRALVEPVRTIVDRGGKAWRSYLALACCDAVGGDSQAWLDWLALPELMHVGSLMVDDIQDGSLIRRGGPAAHTLYGDALTINAGTACYFLPQLFLSRASLRDSHKLRIYEQYFEASRAAHAGQALDLAGYADAMAEIVETGDAARAERHVRAVHHLKSAVPAGCLARIGAIFGDASPEQVDALGAFVEGVGLAFQIIDDVLNLSGFDGEYKTRAEDISAGKLTMPVAKAMHRLPRDDRSWLWSTLSSRAIDRTLVADVIRLLDECGAIADARCEASNLIEDGWQVLSPLLPESQAKVMLRAFSWFVLERHY